MSIDEIRKIFQVEHHHDGKFSNPQCIKNNNKAEFVVWCKKKSRIYEFKINISTLSSLLSILFYLMTWSEFFRKVSIKKPGLSIVLFQGCHSQFLGSIKHSGLDILQKYLLIDQYFLFFKF